LGRSKKPRKEQKTELTSIRERIKLSIMDREKGWTNGGEITQGRVNLEVKKKGWKKLGENRE